MSGMQWSFGFSCLFFLKMVWICQAFDAGAPDSRVLALDLNINCSADKSEPAVLISYPITFRDYYIKDMQLICKNGWIPVVQESGFNIILIQYPQPSSSLIPATCVFNGPYFITENGSVEVYNMTVAVLWSDGTPSYLSLECNLTKSASVSNHSHPPASRTNQSTTPSTRPQSQSTSLPTFQTNTEPASEPTSQPTPQPTSQPTNQTTSQPTTVPTPQAIFQPTSGTTNRISSPRPSSSAPPGQSSIQSIPLYSTRNPETTAPHQSGSVTTQHGLIKWKLYCGNNASIPATYIVHPVSSKGRVVRNIQILCENGWMSVTQKIGFNVIIIQYPHEKMDHFPGMCVFFGPYAVPMNASVQLYNVTMAQFWGDGLPTYVNIECFLPRSDNPTLGAQVDAEHDSITTNVQSGQTHSSSMRKKYKPTHATSTHTSSTSRPPASEELVLSNQQSTPEKTNYQPQSSEPDATTATSPTSRTSSPEDSPRSSTPAPEDSLTSSTPVPEASPTSSTPVGRLGLDVYCSQNVNIPAKLIGLVTLNVKKTEINCSNGIVPITQESGFNIMLIHYTNSVLSDSPGMCVFWGPYPVPENDSVLLYKATARLEWGEGPLTFLPFKCYLPKSALAFNPDTSPSSSTLAPRTSSTSREPKSDEYQTSSTPAQEATPTSSTPAPEASPTLSTPVPEASPTSSTPVPEASLTSSTPVREARLTSSTPAPEASPTSSTPVPEASPSSRASVQTPSISHTTKPEQMASISQSSKQTLSDRSKLAGLDVYCSQNVNIPAKLIGLVTLNVKKTEINCSNGIVPITQESGFNIMLIHYTNSVLSDSPGMCVFWGPYPVPKNDSVLLYKATARLEWDEGPLTFLPFKCYLPKSALAFNPDTSPSSSTLAPRTSSTSRGPKSDEYQTSSTPAQETTPTSSTPAPMASPTSSTPVPEAGALDSRVLALDLNINCSADKSEPAVLISYPITFRDYYIKDMQLICKNGWIPVVQESGFNIILIQYPQPSSSLIPATCVFNGPYFITENGSVEVYNMTVAVLWSDGTPSYLSLECNFTKSASVSNHSHPPASRTNQSTTPSTRPQSQSTSLPTFQTNTEPASEPTSQPTPQPTSQPTNQTTSQPTTVPTPQAIFQPTSGTTNRISSPRPSSSAPPGQSSIQSIPLYSTPNPETTAPHQSGSVTTQHGLIKWKLYCGNNAIIPATYIVHPVSSKGQVARNIQILCENGWMSVTQKIGFNVIIIQYPHEKMDHFPGMCVFFGPYAVPMNASVQLYNVTMAQFWEDGLPTYVNIECFLPRSDNPTLGAQVDAEHDSITTNEQSGQTHSSSMRQKYKPTHATSTHTSSTSRPPASEELVLSNQQSTPEKTNYQPQSSEPDATTATSPTSRTSSPEDSPRSSTPAPENSLTSSTPVPEARPTSSTPVGRLGLDVYCSQNVNIPAKLIGLVTLNVKKTEINCSNGIVPITQEFGFNIMLIHYTNSVLSDSPGMCVFWGPYPVPENDSVLLYKATARLEWGEGPPTFLPFKCYLPKSALAFNPDTSPSSSTLAPRTSPTSREPKSDDYQTSSTPVPEDYPTSSTPAPEASPTSSTPVPEASPTSSTPVPEASPTSSTPVPEASPTSSTPVPEASPTSSTPVGRLGLDVYCSQNVNIPAKLIGLVTLNVKKTEINCSNGIVPITQESGFNIMLIHYTNSVLSDSPGMCVFWGPYPVPKNDSVLLYKATARLEWDEGPLTFLPFKCYLPKSALAFNPDTSPSSSTLAPRTSSTSREPRSDDYQTSSTPAPEDYPTSSTPAPEASPTSSTPVPEVSPTSSTPVPEASPTSSTPVPEASPTSSTPVPEASPTSSTPVPEASLTSSTPVPEASPTSSTPVGRLGLDVYCSQNVNIPAKLIGLVTLNVKKTEINCSNGIVPITQEFGFNIMLIHYTNSVLSDSPGMCVFWGPYPVPENDSVLLYKVTARLEWGEGPPTFLPFKCYLPKSALAFNPDTSPSSSTLAPRTSPTSREPKSDDYQTSSIPAQEATPTSSTPAPEASPSSSASVQTPSISHTTKPEQMASISQSSKQTLSDRSKLAGLDVYCGQNVNIPAKLIGLVTLNVKKTEINCSNGIVPITQEFGFNIMLIHYTNSVLSDSPGMCVFWGPYPVPKNDSVLLYNATARLEWKEGPPTFSSIKCILLKSNGSNLSASETNTTTTISSVSSIEAVTTVSPRHVTSWKMYCGSSWSIFAYNGNSRKQSVMGTRTRCGDVWAPETQIFGINMIVILYPQHTSVKPGMCVFSGPYQVSTNDSVEMYNITVELMQGGNQPNPVPVKCLLPKSIQSTISISTATTSEYVSGSTSESNTSPEPGSSTEAITSVALGCSTEANTSPEPGSSTEPNTSPEPGSSTEPNTSAAPGSSTEENTSPESRSSTEANTSAAPGSTTEENTSPAPGSSTEQNTSAAPGSSTEPNTSAAPGSSTEPNTSPEPGSSTEPNTSPEPGSSTEPNTSPEPGSSTEPNTSPEPGSSTEPNTSPEPGSSTEPNTSPEPGSSTEPNTSPEPGSSTEPNTSPEPGSSTEQNTSPEPGSSTEANTSPEPGSSTEPNTSAAPGSSTEPNTSPEPGSSTEPNTSAAPGSSTEPNTSPEPGSSTEPNTSAVPEICSKESSSAELGSNTDTNSWSGAPQDSSNHIIKVIPHCRKGGDAALIEIITDADLSAVAVCSNGSRHHFKSTDSIHFYLTVSYNITPSVCSFTHSDANVYKLRIDASWNDRLHNVNTQHEHFLVTCTFDTHIRHRGWTSVSSKTLIAPVEIQAHQGSQGQTGDFVLLKLVDILNNTLAAAVPMSKKVRLVGEVRDSDRGLKPVSCDAVGVQHGQTHAILRAGCGDGIVFSKDIGFITEGNKTFSPVFEVFKLHGNLHLTFMCNFTLCANTCDGSSCSKQRRARRSAAWQNIVHAAEFNSSSVPSRDMETVKVVLLVALALLLSPNLQV